MIKTETFEISTKGGMDIINISKEVHGIIKKHNLREGSVLVFVAGTTASVAVIECEPGHIKDLKEMFESIAPVNKAYNHPESGHDDNGSSHLLAPLLGQSLAIPFIDGELMLGTWQQIVLVDFDTRERKRNVIVQANGE